MMRSPARQGHAPPLRFPCHHRIKNVVQNCITPDGHHVVAKARAQLTVSFATPYFFRISRHAPINPKAFGCRYSESTEHTASEFLKHIGRNWPNPDCSFYPNTRDAIVGCVALFYYTVGSKGSDPRTQCSQYFTLIMSLTC